MIAAKPFFKPRLLPKLRAVEVSENRFTSLPSGRELDTRWKFTTQKAGGSHRLAMRDDRGRTLYVKVDRDETIKVLWGRYEFNRPLIGKRIVDLATIFHHSVMRALGR